MKFILLGLMAIALASCQSHPSGSTHAHEPVPMGSGRVETMTPSQYRR